MNTALRRATAAAATALAALLLCSCATPRDGALTPGAEPPRFGDVQPAPPEGDVVGTGTVMDKPRGDGRAIELCLGAVAESYPPQCGGIPLEGWDWGAVEGEEAAADHTWGAYAVTGRYDGATFTVSGEPIPLALFDPPAAEDPTGGEAGTTSEAELARVQQSIADRQGETPFILGSGAYGGYVWVDVVWDDGTLQDAADAEFGDGVVIVQSVLRPAG